MENQGGIKELTIPEGFERKEHQDGVQSSFSPKDAPEARLRYERRQTFAGPPEAMQAYQELMTPGPDNPPHKLTEEEIDRIVPAIPNAPFGHNAFFKDLSINTEDVGGQRVLSMRANYADTDRQAYGVFANPNQKNETIDALWFEGPKEQFEQHEKNALEAIRSVKWRQD